MLEGSFSQFAALEVKMILSSLSPKHPKGELVDEIKCEIFRLMYLLLSWSLSQGTTGNKYNPVLFAMWIDFNSDALRTLKWNKLSFSFLTRSFCVVMWDPVGKWRYSHCSFSPSLTFSECCPCPMGSHAAGTSSISLCYSTSGSGHKR